jgi:hypothetical protein
MAYLSDVKSQLRAVFDEAFDYAWKDVMEPALKQSYRNGFLAGKAGDDSAGAQAESQRRRQWGRRPKSSEGEG